jgi:DNA-binding transcriptional LysR family regulator
MKLEARLRAFAAFARQRSFSAAATELRVSQPAISKHIAELEHVLGLKLVERAKRDGALTKVGDFVANHVLRAESLLMQAALGATQFRENSAGSVAVVASSLTGRYLLPEIIAEFQHSDPDVRVSLQVGTAGQAVELLRSHHAELGFVAGTVVAPEIEAEPLFEYDVPIVGIARQLKENNLDFQGGRLGDTNLVRRRLGAAGHYTRTAARAAIKRSSRPCTEARIWDRGDQPLRDRCRVANRIIDRYPSSRMECS